MYGRLDSVPSRRRKLGTNYLYCLCGKDSTYLQALFQSMATGKSMKETSSKVIASSSSINHLAHGQSVALIDATALHHGNRAIFAQFDNGKVAQMSYVAHLLLRVKATSKGTSFALVGKYYIYII